MAFLVGKFFARVGELVNQSLVKTSFDEVALFSKFCVAWFQKSLLVLLKIALSRNCLHGEYPAWCLLDLCVLLELIVRGKQILDVALLLVKTEIVLRHELPRVSFLLLGQSVQGLLVIFELVQQTIERRGLVVARSRELGS